ncbi:hypothetical protein KJ618_03695 [Patescibacteria group bacterium]|nr:hypothetical protein [Patescibacteria group bacterium]
MNGFGRIAKQGIVIGADQKRDKPAKKCFADQRAITDIFDWFGDDEAFISRLVQFGNKFF